MATGHPEAMQVYGDPATFPDHDAASGRFSSCNVVTGPFQKFSEPLEDPGMKFAFLDRLGLLTALAVLLVVVAYGYPIWQHLQMPRFGSPGFSPF